MVSSCKILSSEGRPARPTLGSACCESSHDTKCFRGCSGYVDEYVRRKVNFNRPLPCRVAPAVPMMKAAQVRTGIHRRVCQEPRFDWAAIRGILFFSRSKLKREFGSGKSIFWSRGCGCCIHASAKYCDRVRRSDQLFVPLEAPPLRRAAHQKRTAQQSRY